MVTGSAGSDGASSSPAIEAWRRRVRGDDGLLARDANSNGTIDGIAELFGNQSKSGFTMLAACDLNADGVIALIATEANDNAPIRLAA